MCFFCNNKEICALNKKRHLEIMKMYVVLLSLLMWQFQTLRHERWGLRFLCFFCRLGGFSQEELLKIWKGLFYCVWVQEEPLLQVTYSSLCHTAGFGAPIDKRDWLVFCCVSPLMCLNRWKSWLFGIRFLTSCPYGKGCSVQALRLIIFANTHKLRIDFIGSMVDFTLLILKFLSHLLLLFVVKNVMALV